MFLYTTCATLHESAISFISAITVSRHVVNGHPVFLLPGGVHVKDTLGDTANAEGIGAQPTVWRRPLCNESGHVVNLSSDLTRAVF